MFFCVCERMLHYLTIADLHWYLWEAEMDEESQTRRPLDRLGRTNGTHGIADICSHSLIVSFCLLPKSFPLHRPPSLAVLYPSLPLRLCSRIKEQYYMCIQHKSH